MYICVKWAKRDEDIVIRSCMYLYRERVENISVSAEIEVLIYICKCLFSCTSCSMLVING